MHELGICDALLKLVDGIAKDEAPDGVISITVEVGSLSGVIPAYLKDCWRAVTDGTAYDKTELITELLPGEAQCLDCGNKFIADLNKLSCPKCNGTKLTPLSGRELTLKEIQAK